MWAIAYVDARRELSFAEWLKGKSVSSFIPVARKLVKPKRKHKPVVITSPLFLHYVFVDIIYDEQWSVVRRAPMFYYFISIDRRAVIVDKASIAELMSLNNRGAFDELPVEKELKIFEGAFLQINKGVFEGKRGVVLEVPRQGAGSVLLDVQGLKVKIGLSLLGEIV